MDLNETIIHAQQIVDGGGVDGRNCAYQHHKLIDWLNELRAYRSIGSTERYAAFEATGLEPEDIQQVKEALDTISFKRFREIMEAEWRNEPVAHGEKRNAKHHSKEDY